ncbi:hypothetical protein DFH08DRAFT_870577 [Mycena albidolilacea]|uniref:Uncharacterized protein n=1 Tax=Mycena albidolilacea TaxID=1033008 RepID=A0AAD6ZYN1_9AGAR|nr:hypothetical protein DFH08DRAFT_870577 [Mycena albidolilacea]
MSSSSSSGMFSMSSPSSSGASLARVQTQTSQGSNRSRPRPRPRSPPSMYVALESSMAKPPKPLIKLDKKSKGKAPQAQPKPSSPPNPFPTRERSYTSPAPSIVSEPPQRRPSVSSFFSLRRKPTVTVEIPPSPVIPRRSEPPPLRVPPPHPVHLHETNVHPVDDIPPSHRRPDKASRMLGKSSHSPDDRGVVVSEFSGTFRISPSPSSRDGERSSLDGDSYLDDSEVEFEDGLAFTDDAHIHRRSRLLSPIEFATARPTSGQFPPQPQQQPPTPPAEDADWPEPATPVAPLPPRRPRTAPHSSHSRYESYASIHNHYTTPSSRESTATQFRPDAFRPDTPFLDTLVAVNSQVVVSPRHTHAREPSVVRTEAREGWMGEWNQDDMQDVIQKLRSLK